MKRRCDGISDRGLGRYRCPYVGTVYSTGGHVPEIISLCKYCKADNAAILGGLKPVKQSRRAA